MATQGDSAPERVLRKALVPVCVLSGILVVSGFFFPSLVVERLLGSLVSQ